MHETRALRAPVGLHAAEPSRHCPHLGRDEPLQRGQQVPPGPLGRLVTQGQRRQVHLAMQHLMCVWMWHRRWPSLRTNHLDLLCTQPQRLVQSQLQQGFGKMVTSSHTFEPLHLLRLFNPSASLLPDDEDADGGLPVALPLSKTQRPGSPGGRLTPPRLEGPRAQTPPSAWPTCWPSLGAARGSLIQVGAEASRDVTQT